MTALFSLVLHNVAASCLSSKSIFIRHCILFEIVGKSTYSKKATSKISVYIIFLYCPRERKFCLFNFRSWSQFWAAFKQPAGWPIHRHLPHLARAEQCTECSDLIFCHKNTCLIFNSCFRRASILWNHQFRTSYIENIEIWGGKGRHLWALLSWRLRKPFHYILLFHTTVHLKIYYCRLSEVVLPSVGKFILKTFTNSLTYTRANANDDICLSLFLIFTLWKKGDLFWKSLIQRVLNISTSLLRHRSMSLIIPGHRRRINTETRQTVVVITDAAMLRSLRSIGQSFPPKKQQRQFASLSVFILLLCHVSGNPLFFLWPKHRPTWCRSPWARRRTPRWGWAWARAWWRGGRCAGARWCTPPWACPARWSAPCRSTPQTPAHRKLRVLFSISRRASFHAYLILTSTDITAI